LLPEEAVDQTTPSQLIRFLSDDEALRGIDSILAKIRGSNND
jgi:hypothetical protein